MCEGIICFGSYLSFGYYLRVVARNLLFAAYAFFNSAGLAAF